MAPQVAPLRRFMHLMRGRGKGSIHCEAKMREAVTVTLCLTLVAKTSGEMGRKRLRMT